MFPELETLIVPYFTSELDVRATTELENDFPVPILHVESLGATDDGFRLARSQVDVDAYAATRDEARTLAHRAQAALMALRGTPLDGRAVVTFLGTVVGPRWIASQRTVLRRFGATYLIGAHSA